MALVMKNEPMSITDILQWLGTTFVHFTYAGIRLNNDGTNLADYHRQRALGQDISRALDKLELPIVQLDSFDFDGALAWQVSVLDARAFLQDALFERKGTFPLLQLPTEIRIMIWEMVLRYPPSGIHLLRKYFNGRRAIAVVDKNYSTPFSSDLSFTDRSNPERFSYTQPLGRSLSLLSVNKQIFEESYAYFYRANLFVFPSVARLGRFLRNTPRSRRQHFTQLAFEYSPADRYVAPGVFSDLVSLKKMSTLYMNIHDAWWRRRWGGSPGSRDEADIDYIPGLATLRNLRGLDHVDITGVTVEIGAQMKIAMEGKVCEGRSAGSKDTKD